MDRREPEKTDVLPSTALAYLDRNYWDKRFAQEEHYEWLKDYSHFRHLLQQHITPHSSVLELGCGNSQLSEELYRDGITELTCIDLSPIAVDKMKQRLVNKGYKEIKVLEADMLDLPFEDGCFDVVIEKGTMVLLEVLFWMYYLVQQWLSIIFLFRRSAIHLYVELRYQKCMLLNLKDVLFVDSGDPWNPHHATVEKVMKMLHEIHRVLKPEGIFISITFGQPHFRRRFFNHPEFTWSVEWNTFGETFHYFLYILKKGQRSSESEECGEKTRIPSISLYHDELEGEDYLFRTNIDEM